MIKLSTDTLRRLIRSHFPQDKYVWKMKKADCLKRLEPYEIKGNGTSVPYYLTNTSLKVISQPTV